MNDDFFSGKKEQGKFSKHPRIRKLEFALEDQIFQVFKKTRVLTSSPNNLFLVPRSRFVYVENAEVSERENKKINGIRSFDADSTDEDSGDDFDDELFGGKRDFRLFLESQIENVLSKGTDGESKSGFEAPTLKQWAESSEAILSVISDLKEGANSAAVNQILFYSNVEMRFSDVRCQKAFNQAFTAYKEGSNAHYPEDLHNAKLMQAMQIFSLSARGPARAKYADILAQECAEFWRGGRQICEEVSLTGRGCANRLHRINHMQEEKKEGKMLPVMPHNSGIAYISACNCGRRQGSREDPFTLAEANWRFYADLEEECCRELQHFPIPVWEPPQDESRNTSELDVEGGESDRENEADVVNEEKKPKRLSTSEKTSTTTLQALADVSRRFTVEPVDHMLSADDDPRKKLPVFSSWSLIHLGSSYLYGHNTGVIHPGFISGAKFLFPWDIPLIENADYDLLKDKWPILADCLGKKDGKITVKAFLGFEYECSINGHRFMAQSPTKPMRMSSNSGLRESAVHRLISSDMPLYMACPGCSKVTSRPAQLMRVHIVTPKAPIHITLMPKVQPCPNGPIFHCGWREPIKLSQNSCWILRLPYIYCGEGGAHLPPAEMPESGYAKLLKGFISTTEDYQEEEEDFRL